MPLNEPEWTPHPRLDAALLPQLRKIIDRIPPAHLANPEAHEVYNSPEEALQRLQNYAFSQGFAVVIASRPKTPPRCRFACIHHGKETRNTRQLDDHVEEGGNRTRELTKIKGKDCNWEVYVSYKSIVRGQDQKAWILGVTRNEHTHPLVPNPMS
jgi:hypothetical protein